METVILESTLIKLGGLLAVGFGVAGAEIIKGNMSGTDSSGVNAMIAGTKVEAIFGFCNIRNFDQEAKKRPNIPLQEKFHRGILRGVRNISGAL